MEPLASRLAHARLWMFALLAYAVLVTVSVGLADRSSAGYWLSSAGGLGLAVGVAVVARRPASAWGLTTRGALASLPRAALATLVICGIVAAAGVAAEAAGLVDPGAVPVREVHDWELLAYVLLSAPLQELVFRGVFQGGARYVFADSRSGSALAVAFSTVAYAASHLPWGIDAALTVVLPGIVWGVLVERDRTLVGVCLSHAIVGYVFFGLTPLWGLLASR